MASADDTSVAAPSLAAVSTDRAAPAPRRRLFRKYALLFIGLVGTALLVNSGFDFWFSYQENKAALVRVQQEKAEAAAQRVEEFVGEIKSQIGWTTHAQWSAGPLDQRRQDYFRLLRQVPAITELTQLDADGREQLTVSRLKMDVVGSNADFSQSPGFTEAKAHRVWFSPVYFRKQSEPYISLAMAREGRNAGVTVAEVNLKLIYDVITALKIGQGGYTYVVDGRGRLLAHPDISLVLRDTDLSKLPQVAAAVHPSPEASAVTVANNIAGLSVLTAHAAIPQLGWQVFVEVPLQEAFAPLYGAAWRTAVLVLLGLVAAALAALVLARRMTGPIRTIAAGAERLGAGDLSGRIDIHTGDELEGLAQQFNRMAADLQKSYAELEQRVRDRTAELSNALARQTATAEVLGIISSSPGFLDPVFEAVLANAVRICGGRFGLLALRDGDGFRGAAAYGVGADVFPLSRLHYPPRGTGLAALQATKQTSQVADCATDPNYEPVRAASPAFAEMRTALHVAMLKEGELIGAIVIYRGEVLPFGDKEIELVENFAKQAVIAIENVRLITEIREALDQQTATAEVLGVINASPGDLTPVFDAMLERAIGLCEAAFGSLLIYDGERLQAAALRSVPDAFAEFLRTPLVPEPGTAMGQVLKERRLIHWADAAAEEGYAQRLPLAVAGVDGGGVRTLLGVPLIKDARVLGIFHLYRQEVRPFSDKQIALLQNFAAQAVIAMENARLITETREALEQQTATAEVLGVINASPGDLAPVFEAMLEKATTLCEAAHGALFIKDGERFRAIPSRSTPHEFAEFLTRAPVYFDLDPERSIMGRTLRQRAAVQVPDLRESEPYRNKLPIALAAVETAGSRTLLSVPMYREDVPVGIFQLARQEVRPFTEKQIALLSNFAAQAVIAIENTRLINETREALEQQTATAEVLGVINSSPGDLAPVFDAMLEKAARLCEAAFGLMNTYDGEQFHTVAVRGVPAPLEAWLLQSTAAQPGPLSAPMRVIQGETVVQMEDIAASEGYRLGEARTRAIVELGGARSYITVALRKDITLLGNFSLYRQEVRPFTDKQIALLQNFAAQAVIAIENARLITETREALEQQTATAEVLGVINASPGDLAPVFEAMLEKAIRLCEGIQGTLWTFAGEHMLLAASQGLSLDLIKLLRETREHQDPGERDPVRRIMRGERLIQVLDLTADRSHGPVFEAAAAHGGVRTIVVVGLFKDALPLGAFVISRRDVRLFSDKQIALLQNFAAQAVIAMENARLITETREALEQQTATAEILRVVSGSQADVQPVFEAIVESASKLCEAELSAVARYDGTQLDLVAINNMSPEEAAAFHSLFPRVPLPTFVMGRAVVECRPVNIEDILAEPGYDARTRQTLADPWQYRSFLSVPILREGAPIGVIGCGRREVRPFTAKQMELVRTFADQAVIAIENARLITETREALAQQTATAEVLGVINASPGDLAPVFNSILEKAHSLCGATRGALFLNDGERLRAAATHGYPEGLAEQLRQGFSTSDPSLALLAGARLIHNPDLRQIDDPVARAVAERGGVRTNLLLPLRKDGVLLGMISCNRHEVRPFTEKEIALLENFAAQAVIAIENARLITETREALEQQTATAEVLGVINASPGDLTPVFDALLKKAVGLCGAAFGMLTRFDGERYHATALHRVPPRFEESWREPRHPTPGLALYRLIQGEDIVHVEDVTAEDAYQSGNPIRRALADLGGARTALWVALRKDRTLLGAFVLYRQEVRPFAAKQIGLVRTFAEQAVIAIDNARLLNELRDRTRDLQESLEYQTATSDVLKVISQSVVDLDSVLNTVVASAVALCRAEYAVIYRNHDGEYRWAASYGLLPEYDQIERETAIQPGRDTLIGRVALEGRTVAITDAWNDREYEAKDAARFGNVRSMIGVPLLREGAVIGAIGLARGTTDPYTDREIQLVTTFADQAVIAIENARLFNELRERTDELAHSVEELKALGEVGQAVSSTLDLGAVLSTILNRSVALAGADAGAIFRYGGADRAFRLAEAVGWDDVLIGKVRELRIAESETGMGEAARRRTPLQLTDLTARPSYPLRDATLAAGFRSVLIVPLVGAERIFGAIVLERRVAGEFPEAAVRLMQTLASQSVLAIQNARLFREIADKSEELRLASQHKSQFLANMSHELRTPMNAILGYTELMVDGIYGDLPEKAAGVLERVQNNGKHLLALINDVLDLSKIEAGQLVFTLEDYALPDVVQSVVTATEALASTKGLKMTADVAPGLPMGRGDARRLSQVLLNLVGNAVKFTDEGDVAIDARAENGHFVLTVRDTGPGIAAEDQGKIFEEFQQVDSSNTRKKGGTGLGLAISKRMVEMQGGSISVASELGHGATFRVSLPIRVEEIAEELMGAA